MFAWKLAWRAGIATLTIVLSMNAMLEARMVAARIHGCAALAQGAPSLPERRTTSSQGVFTHLWMRRPCTKFLVGWSTFWRTVNLRWVSNPVLLIAHLFPVACVPSA